MCKIFTQIYKQYVEVNLTFTLQCETYNNEQSVLVTHICDPTPKIDIGNNITILCLSQRNHDNRSWASIPYLRTFISDAVFIKEEYT